MIGQELLWGKEYRGAAASSATTSSFPFDSHSSLQRADHFAASEKTKESRPVMRCLRSPEATQAAGRGGAVSRICKAGKHAVATLWSACPPAPVQRDAATAASCGDMSDGSGSLVMTADDEQDCEIVDADFASCDQHQGQQSILPWHRIFHTNPAEARLRQSSSHLTDRLAKLTTDGP